MSTNRGIKRQREEEEPEATTSRKKSKRQRLPEKSVRVLHNWFEDHKTYPYPTPKEKQRLATEANLTLGQLERWFKSAREKLKKAGGPPRNIPVQTEGNKENENPTVRTIFIGREPNVVPLDEVTTMDNAAVLLLEINVVPPNEADIMDNEAEINAVPPNEGPSKDNPVVTSPEIVDFYDTFEQYFPQLLFLHFQSLY